MALKFNNSKAELFGEFLKHKCIEKVKEVIKEEFYTGCTEEEKERTLKVYEKELTEVKSFYDKIKFFDKPQIYRVNIWGFGQNNYENLKVLGEVENSVVCVLDETNTGKVWVVSKNKFNNKEYAKLDDVRNTSWNTPFSHKEIREQEEYNTYYGY